VQCPNGAGGPLPVAEWNRKTHRQVLALRDRIMSRLGTAELLIAEHRPTAMTWRKPLSVVEVNQLAPTPEVRARPGRP
jgi:hypothetical protein